MSESAERKTAEPISLRSAERLQATFDQAAVGVAYVGLDGRLLRANQKLCAIVGYGHDEMVALTFEDAPHPHCLDTDLDDARRLLAGEISTYSIQKRCVRKDKSLACIKLTVSLARTPEGQPDHFIFIIEDIAERKLAEEHARTLVDSIPQLCWMAEARRIWRFLVAVIAPPAARWPRRRTAHAERSSFNSAAAAGSEEAGFWPVTSLPST